MIPRLVAVVGATATGKTALAIRLARELDGEIVNADSRQVYCGMDIGTAKPTAEERAAARHWLIDCVEPDEPFSLADYLDRAHAAIGDISSRGKLPIVAGGTGQYVWALLEGWRVPRVPPDHDLRASLEDIAATDGTGALAAVLAREDPVSASRIDPRNVRRVIRAIEVTRASGRAFSEWQEKDGPPAAEVRTIALTLNRDDLYRRIDDRVDAMLAAGLVDEVRTLRERYGCGAPPMSGIGYRQVCDALEGRCSLEDAAARIKTETHRLARMQHAWFRRDDPLIVWLDAASPRLFEDALAAVRAAA
jgi:tRNA dimethylallyltransferase